MKTAGSHKSRRQSIMKTALATGFLAAAAFGVTTRSGLTVPVLDVVTFGAARFVVMDFVVIRTGGVPRSSLSHVNGSSIEMEPGLDRDRYIDSNRYR